MVYNYRVMVCPVCGKSFVPAPQHVYKIHVGDNDRKVCSWTCVRTHERKNKPRRKQIH